MNEPRPFRFETAPGSVLHGLLDVPDGPGPHPAIVVCHGFKGFMEWGFFPALAELLRSRGYLVVRFNFSGSGMLPGEDRVSDPDAFCADTYSLEVSELRSVLDAVGREIGGGLVQPGPVGLFGHSRGGGVAVLAAADNPKRIGALVTWAAIAEVDRFTAEQKDAWRRDGELAVVNGRTGQQLALGLGLLRDIEENAEALDLVAAARRCDLPWLIVHGTADETVAMTDAETLEAAAEDAPDVELLPIDRGGHTFGAVHPFAGPTRELTQALNATQAWFRRNLPIGW